MSKDKEYWHNRGEQDAASGRHKPPHQGGVFSENWWGSDMNGRPVTDKDKQADYDSYETGWENADDED